MILKTYQAYTMAEALAAVRRDIGPDAIILHTRAFKRGGFLGIGRSTIVEVTARPPAPAGAPEKQVAKTSPPRAATMNRGTATAFRARQAYGSASTVVEAETRVEKSGVVTLLERERTRRLAQMMAERHDRQRPATTTRSPGGPGALVEAGVSAVHSHAESRIRSEPAATVPLASPSVAKRFVLGPTEPSPAASAATPAVAPSRPGPSALAAPPRRQSPDEVRTELAAIRDMVGRVLRHQSSGPRGPRSVISTMPQRLFDMYLRLVAQDVSDELADQVVSKVRRELGDDVLDNEQVVHESVVRNLAEFIPAADPPNFDATGPRDRRPYTIALVGPTGVGKTTTLAKLAATIKLNQKKSVGLITCDTYRIAAVDQLRTYANIIGIPLEVVLCADQMAGALRTLRDREVILIDTAGRGQNDAGKLAELREFLDASQPHETHLVLSSTSSERVLIREAEAFGGVGVDKLVLTKLDEAVSFGVLVNVIQKIGKQLSYITTGQEVPDHIEPGRGVRLADLVLAGEVAL